MINFSLTAPAAVDVELEPDTLLGGKPAVSGNRASFGGPDVTPLTPEALRADPDLVNFVAGSGYAYYLLAMTLSLAAAPGGHIQDSTVGILLDSPGGPAIAWSMSPLRLDGPPVTTKLGASIQVGVGPMLKVGGDHSREVAVAEHYLVALGELEADPEWRLRRTPTAELTGLHEFVMVVRGPKDQPVNGKVQVTASIAGTRGLFRSAAALPSKQTSFVCGP